VAVAYLAVAFVLAGLVVAEVVIAQGGLVELVIEQSQK
jgi:hypothetical protein